MKISNLMEGYFLERPNRFTVVFEASQGIYKAHLRDPGRLKELLIPGVRLLLRPALNPDSRKTKYDVIAVWSEGIWVLINSGFHSDLAAELIESGLLPEVSDYNIERREYTFGKSRIDFLLKGYGDDLLNGDGNNLVKGDGNNLLNGDENKMLLEVKGCTLVEDGWARFPDAPTQRGKKHLEELIKARKEGLNASVLFLITREDALTFSPNWEMDPDFSKTLVQAQEENVKIIAHSFKNLVDGNKLEIKPFRPVKVKLGSK
jgi:sugar fermentation stimulation protein A